MSNPELISRVAARLGTLAGFIAFELDRYRRITGVDPTEDFDIPSDVLPQLALCRVPRRDTYSVDLMAIGTRVTLPPAVLANFLRAVDSVNALAVGAHSTAATRISKTPNGGTRQGQVSTSTSGMLAAARDHVDEHTDFEQPIAGVASMPGWLIRAIERFWAEHKPSESFPRDLHLPVLLNLPIAIIEIDQLTLAGLDLWLHRHRLPRIAEGLADRPLRGCLLAYAGVGIVFVDRGDDAAERRLTLAHEAGHFLIDYLLPREDVIDRRPGLLAILDGDREPTTAERFDALLADVPLGFHTHLLERDDDGAHQSATTAAVEDRAERLALELLAPLQSVLAKFHALTSSGNDDLPALLHKQFGLPAGTAARYAQHVQRIQPPPTQTLWEAIGLTERSTPPGTGDEEPAP